MGYGEQWNKNANKGVFMISKKGYSAFGVLLFVLGLLFVYQAYDLWSTPVHVGLDVKFYGFLIKKGVPEAYLYNYMAFFLVVGLILLVSSVYLFKKSKSNN
jgi:hypothetical protein